jgi:hypothetical protein
VFQVLVFWTDGVVAILIKVVRSALVVIVNIYIYCICYINGDVSYKVVRKCFLAFRLEIIVFQFYIEHVSYCDACNN